jgi:methionine synthase II (cobalamin-independent)
MGIAMRGERGVLRPFPAKVFDSEDDALKYAQQNSHLFSNIRDVSKSYSLSVGMFSVETDRIEHSRFLRDYVSTE